MIDTYADFVVKPSTPFAFADHAWEAMHPKDILAAIQRTDPGALLAFSGSEDVVLVDMACRQNLDFPVFALDTGRLHPETYRFLDQVRERYGIGIEVLMPDAAEVEALVRDKGLFSFYRDGHQECCQVRKVNPLRRRLGAANAWITGQRRDQSPTRSDVPVAETDPGSLGRDGEPMRKYNPLATWSSAQVWEYIHVFEVPYNPLHDKGFVSIGCEPCTRPIHPGQHEREGRWWWEEATLKECGLHQADRPQPG